MQLFPETYILRHRRENLKKCSLRGLETRTDLRFYKYPRQELPPLPGYILLALDAPPLTIQDRASGLLIVDGTWRYAETMIRCALSKQTDLHTRSLPTHLRTAYPRRQEDCDEPDKGLASVEALYASYVILGRDPTGLLDHYYWKERFLQQELPKSLDLYLVKN